MPLELDPEEVAFYQQLAQEAREQLQRVAPRGTTLLLQHHGTDPRYTAHFWQVTVHVLDQEKKKIDVNSYLCNILAIAEKTPSPSGHYLSWYGEESDIDEAITRHLGTEIWNDPHAYTYQIVDAFQEGE